MSDLFFYDIKKTETETLKGFFHIDSIIRGIQFPDGTMVVALNDFHESMEPVQIPVANRKYKAGEKPEYKFETRKVETNSEIQLLKEDADRFIQLYGN